MNVFNQDVPFEVYKTFQDLVRKSRLCAQAGTIALSTEGASLEINATLLPLDREAVPSHLGRALTAERLFAQVHALLAGASKPRARAAEPSRRGALAPGGEVPHTTPSAAGAPMPSPPTPSALPETLEHPGPGRWWWLCFVDPARSEGRQFLGVAIVEGATLREAMEQASALGIHPGGQVASVACTLYVPAPRWRNRLLTRQDVIAAGNDVERP